MAVSQIEEKILGRLAKQTAPSNALLSASLYQVLGLSILLTRKIYRARKVRRLDITRDTKSLQLYHQIIWLAREGLSITEVYVLPYCQDGEQGPECRVMAAKLRASFYHIFCLFHNHPPVTSISPRSIHSRSSPRKTHTPREETHISPGKSPSQGREPGQARRRAGRSSLRDPIPSMTSDTSYVTNPYAGPASTPPPPGPVPPVPPEANRRTPNRPPGLAPINIPSPQAAASFLLPPLNFVPMAREHFETAQRVASELLYPAHALRLSVSVEYAVFLWDCAKEQDRARRLARHAIKKVYASTDGLDDDEFIDASNLVQALVTIMNRSGTAPKDTIQPRPSNDRFSNTTSPDSRPPIDRPDPVSPTSHRGGTGTLRRTTTSPLQRSSIQRTPDRLSTVPEIESSDPTTQPTPLSQAPYQNQQPPPQAPTPPQPRRPSTASDKASKRRRAEEAEQEVYSRRASATSSATASRRPSVTSTTNRNNNTSGSQSQSHSRQPTPQEGYVRSLPPAPASGAASVLQNEAKSGRTAGEG